MNVNIIEGFDMVGKSAVPEYINLTDPSYYHMEYEKDYPEMNRDFSYLIGYSIYDYLSRVGLSKDLIMDRGLPSSYVYGSMSDEATIRYVHLMEKVPTVIYHLDHHNKHSAKIIYAWSKLDGNHNDSLDQFETFDEYWDSYMSMTDKFNRFYDSYIINSKVKLVRLQSFPSSDGSHRVSIERE